MDKIQRALRICRNDGLYSLFQSIVYYFLPTYYQLKFIYFNHKLRSDFDTIPDPTKLVRVDPQIINKGISQDKIAEASSQPIPKWGFLDGEWDKNTYKISEHIGHKSLVDHFENGVKWENTPIYQRVVEKLESGGKSGALEHTKQTEEGYRELLEYRDELFHSIKTEGYKTQRELSNEDNFAPIAPKITNEVILCIGRDGEFILKGGNHRVSMAKILELDYIPVFIKLRHTEWQETRESIASSKTHNQTEIGKNHLSHPDLQDVLSAAEGGK